MPTLSVRVSEDPARPLGHAIVTLGGLPRTLETFEFALSRHGFAANHLGPDGWQGAECWLQPEEAWYSGDALKFVVHPDLAFQLENMPYKLAVRGQGLAETAAVTFVWPLELEIETGAASGERRVVGGTRVDPAPKPRPELAASGSPPDEPPPLPQLVGNADLTLPDVVIPEIGVDLEAEGDGTMPTRAVGRRVGEPPAMPDAPIRAMEEGARPPISGSDPIPVVEPTRKVSGRLIPPARDDGQQPPAAPAMPVPPPPSPPPDSVEEPATVPLRRPASIAAPPPIPSQPADEKRRGGRSGALLIGLILAAALAALVALGGWWFSQHAGAPSIKSTSAPLPSNASVSIKRAPEPTPAPEPIPAPVPVPAPEPIPAPVPVPAPEPIPAPPIVAPIPKVPPNAQPSAPPGRPSSGRSLEDELKSQFDPTVQELEKSLRPRKSP
jgi:hypothetical protein